MHRHLQALVLAAALLCALLLGAGPCRAADLVAVPRATSRVVDQAGLLTAAERAAIEARLKEVQQSGRAQIGLLISPGTGSEDLPAFALRVAQAWQLGTRGGDNGLLVVVMPSTGVARIEVGYGLEGDMPDLRAATVVRAYQQRMQAGSPAAPALNAMLDSIVDALPPATHAPRTLTRLVRQHADWKLPIVMLVASVFTLLPLLVVSVFGRLGSGTVARAWPSAGTCLAALLSAGLFAWALAVGARAFWASPAAGQLAAAVAFPLPLLWSLNAGDGARMGLPARIGRAIGQLGLFVYLFAAVTVIAGAAMYVEKAPDIWAVPLVAMLFAAGPLAFLVGGRVGAGLRWFLGHYLYFLVALVITCVALQGVLTDVTTTAVTVSAVFTTLVAVGLTLDDRAQRRRADQQAEVRGGHRQGGWAWMFIAAALLFLLPFMLLALAHALTGDAFNLHFAAAMAPDGGFSAFVWWASGALGGSALLVGLGGRFGGGGAGG